MQTLFGPYEPDKAPFLQSGLTDMANAYPGANGFRPVGQFASVTSSLNDDFYGGAAFVASTEAGTLIAGTLTALYKYSGGAWGALETGLATSSRWQFTQFGDYVICVNGGPTQQVDLLAGTAAPLVGAPSGTSVATVRDFVVYGGAAGNAALVQWSAFNDQNGNTPGVDQAGYQPMLTGGDVQGIIGGEYGLIIQRNRVVRMTYTADTTDDVPLVWQFDEIAPNVGAVSKGSITNSGRRTYFLSDRGFMFCDGNDVTPIGNERVDATFFKTYSRQQLDQIYAAIDPKRTTVAWLVPGATGRIWVYNWQLDQWSIISIPAKGILSGFTTAISLEQLDTLYPSGLDSIPYSLDDARFAGGDPLFLVVNMENSIGTLSGANMAARFVTPYQELIAGRRTRLRFVRPISDVNRNLTLTLECRQMLGGSPSTSSYSSLNGSGDFPVRAEGRYVRTTFDYAAGATWTYVQGVEHTGVPGGSR